MKNLSKFTKTCIILAIITIGCLTLSGIFSAIAYGSVVGMQEDFQLNDSVLVENTDKLTQINVEGFFSQIEVIPAKDNQIKFELAGQLSAHSRPSLKQTLNNSDTAITVSLNAEKWSSWGSWISLPESWTRVDVILKVSIPESYTGTLCFDMASGDINIDGIHAEDIIINGFAGEVTVSSFWSTLDINGTIGDLSVDCSILNGGDSYVEVNGFTGDIDIKTNSTQLFTSATEGFSGDLSYRKNGKHVSSLHPSGGDFTGSVNLNIFGAVGSVTVDQVD